MANLHTITVDNTYTDFPPVRETPAEFVDAMAGCDDVAQVLCTPRGYVELLRAFDPERGIGRKNPLSFMTAAGAIPVVVDPTLDTDNPILMLRNGHIVIVELVHHD